MRPPVRLLTLLLTTDLACQGSSSLPATGADAATSLADAALPDTASATDTTATDQSPGGTSDAAPLPDSGPATPDLAPDTARDAGLTDAGPSACAMGPPL